jgi:hypothetical protein
VIEDIYVIGVVMPCGHTEWEVRDLWEQSYLPCSTTTCAWPKRTEDELKRFSDQLSSAIGRTDFGERESLYGISEMSWP